jgi:hypothetical protein
MATYRLRNAEAAARAAPRTFSIPRRQRRIQLETGWQVKLVFELPAASNGISAERMWCAVIARSGLGYIGRLTSTPEHVAGLAAGDDIAFGPEHVCGIETGEEAQLGPLVGVGIDVLRRDRWPAWIAKVAPTGEYDSGWRLFSAREGGEGAIVRALTASTLFRSWAVTDSVIEAGIDGVWRWDDAAVEYARVKALPAGLARAAGAGLGRLHASPPDPELGAVITRRALEVPPVFAKRSHPLRDHPDDSGWAIFVGDEAQTGAGTSSTVVRLARLYHDYPYLERVLGETEHGVWAWDDDAGDWRAPVDPWADL